MADWNPEVSIFLDKLNHPMRQEIDLLRDYILGSNYKLTENIKWNAPNYSYDGEDRITMRVLPFKGVQLVFHRGAKVKEQPKDNLISDDFQLLVWKSKDRAIATFTNLKEIEARKSQLNVIIENWIIASI